MRDTTHPIDRAVVTGAAGFIGSHLVRRLVADGAAVVGLDNERSGDWARVDVECTRLARDMCDLTEDEVADLCRGADVLFHLAAEKYNSSRSTPQRVIDVNISATRRLFAGAARAGVRRIVFTSSLYAYGGLGPDPMDEGDVPTPSTMYGMSKVAGEDMLRVVERDHGTPWSVARLFFVYGPRQYAEGGYKSVIVTNFERILRGEAPVVFGDGRQALDYVYVDDVVEGLVRMAGPDGGGILNLGSGRAVTVEGLTHRMLAVAGCELRPVRGPADWTAGTVRYGRVGRAAERLGWTPSVDLDEGLRRVWEWMSGGADGEL